MRRIIGIGETVFDIVFRNNQPQAAIPGGSTFNAMISLGRSGVKCDMVTETGDDHVGDIICDYLRQNGVGYKFVTRHKNTKTHISLAFLNEKNDAEYTFYKDHASAKISDNCPEISKDDVVLFGSFFAINPVIRDSVRSMLKKAHNNKATLYYDINFRKPHIADLPYIMGNIEENMSMCSVVRGSIEDFTILYNETNIDTIYEKHIKPFCPCFICTQADKTIELRTPEISTGFSVKPIDTISTIGAGDNFNAGFLYSLLKTNYRNNLSSMPMEIWQKLILSGENFASNVCQQIGNSISLDFARELDKTRKQ